jgi:hypothetical protein
MIPRVPLCFTRGYIPAPLRGEESHRFALGYAFCVASRRLGAPARQVEAFAVDTIRSVILNRYPELVARISTDPSDEAAFAYALELYLRAIPIRVVLDGWKQLQLVHETATSLRAVGLMTVLPTGERPLEVELFREHGSTRYWLRTGVDDAHWRSLSESKRWKAVYLYASGDRDEQWNWSEPISGYLADA